MISIPYYTYINIIMENWRKHFFIVPKSFFFFFLITCISNIGIKHAFPCINVCQVPREMLKTEAVGRGFQHLPRDLANVNVLENHV